jgi:hypothetical protein
MSKPIAAIRLGAKMESGGPKFDAAKTQPAQWRLQHKLPGGTISRSPRANECACCDTDESNRAEKRYLRPRVKICAAV